MFITGTPEYGKTYTAIKLLWAHFLKGRTPVWIRAQDSPEKLADLESKLQHNHVYYFEDPFGEESYVQSKELVRRIGTLIDSIRALQDVYVIITSREEIFERFKKEQFSLKQLEFFESVLSIKKPSYNSEKRRQTLLDWAEAKGCKWLSNTTVRNYVIQLIANNNYLPTPLSIHDFVMSTINIDNKTELFYKVFERTRETAYFFTFQGSQYFFRLF